jgi:raffinose/stachyose/melibiose transport system substrate-binding protein
MSPSTAKSMNRRKAIIGIAACLPLALGLAGCVGNAQPSSTSTGPTVGQAANITVTSQLGDNPALQKVLNKLNADYEKANPKVHVTIQYETLTDLEKTLPTTLASGSGPDVIDYDANESTLGALAKNNLVIPLTTYATKYGWNKQLSPSASSRTTFSGKLYGVPRSSEDVGLFYNNAILKKFNLPAPTTYKVFLSDANSLKADGVTPITFGNQDQWPSSHLIGAAIHSVVPVSTIKSFETVAGTGSWTSPKVQSAISEAVSWVKDGILTPNFNGVTFADAEKAFYAGQAAMFVEGTGVIPDLQANMNVSDVNFIPFPMTNPSAPQEAEGGPGGAWAITASSKAPAIAADWINYVHFSTTAEKAWLEAGVLPTTTYNGAGVSISPLVKESLQVVQAAQKGGGIGYWTGYSTTSLVTSTWNSGAQEVLQGSETVAQFTADLQSALEKGRNG